jgi:hypothetical protein
MSNSSLQLNGSQQMKLGKKSDGMGHACVAAVHTPIP